MAIDNPAISNYKPFYIQVGNNLYDTRAQWGLIAKSNPYHALPNPKEPYRNDWKNLDGDDEYTTTIKYEAYTFDVDFYIRASGSTADVNILTNISAFFTAIKNVEFKIYDSFTKIGRQSVRYAGYKEGEALSHSGGYARRIFTVTFKVNDPVTFMKLNSGGTAIVEGIG